MKKNQKRRLPVEIQVMAALCDFNEDSSRKSLLARPFDVADTHTDTQALPRVCWVFSTVESILMLLARQITRLHVINVFILVGKKETTRFLISVTPLLFLFASSVLSVGSAPSTRNRGFNCLPLS